GGDGGAKLAIEYRDNVWMLKLPKSTKEYRVKQLSYTTSPLSEYLGSLIYASLGLPVHETVLGTYGRKVVVACKDFTFVNGVEASKIIPFHEIKNSFMSEDISAYSGTGSQTLLEEVLAAIYHDSVLAQQEGVVERFWDMFVIDAFIGNNDRNNGNWGLLKSFQDGSLTLAPVFDNGNSFFSKRGLAQMERRLKDIDLLHEDAYRVPTCVYKYVGYDNQEHQINPYTFMMRAQEPDCNAALERFMKRVNINEICGLIDAIPEVFNDVIVMPQIQKDFYKSILQIRFEEVFKPALATIREKTSAFSPQKRSELAFEIERRAAIAREETGITAQDHEGKRFNR
ncbi:MAG: hypothetical protein SPG61_00860, partial [Arcanobacterium sp.]|nr:hypothetical protein [Arcanobacterium sp.]